MAKINTASASVPALPSALPQEEAEQCCNICNEEFGVPRADGSTEVASILPCSHIFGSICISRWLETDSRYQDCPHCRRRMVYRECGHVIKSCDVAQAPKCVSEKDMPAKCLACRGDRRLKEELRLRKEKRLLEERASQSMKMLNLTRVFGGRCRSTVQSVDWRIAQLRSDWEAEIDALFGDFEQERRYQW